MNRVKDLFAPAFLVVLGCIQMIGDIFDLQPVKGFGAATSASPAPKVFTAHKGFETYSSEFFLMWVDQAGHRQELQLTPEVYGGVQGPYNRRNAYGAALSYAPVLYSNELSRPMLLSAIQYTFCGESTILSEIGVDRNNVMGPYQFELRPRQELSFDHRWKLKFEVTCDEK